MVAGQGGVRRVPCRLGQSVLAVFDLAGWLEPLRCCWASASCFSCSAYCRPCGAPRRLTGRRPQGRGVIFVLVSDALCVMSGRRTCKYLWLDSAVMLATQTTIPGLKYNPSDGQQTTSARRPARERRWRSCLPPGTPGRRRTPPHYSSRSTPSSSTVGGRSSLERGNEQLRRLEEALRAAS